MNISGGSVGGLHKSMTRLSSSQQINAVPGQGVPVPVPPLSNSAIAREHRWNSPRVSSGGVTVTTTTPRIQRPQSQGPLSFITNHGNQVKNRLI